MVQIQIRRYTNKHNESRIDIWGPADEMEPLVAMAQRIIEDRQISTVDEWFEQMGVDGLDMLLIVEWILSFAEQDRKFSRPATKAMGLGGEHGKELLALMERAQWIGQDGRLTQEAVNTLQRKRTRMKRRGQSTRKAKA